MGRCDTPAWETWPLQSNLERGTNAPVIGQTPWKMSFAKDLLGNTPALWRLQGACRPYCMPP